MHKLIEMYAILGRTMDYREVNRERGNLNIYLQYGTTYLLTTDKKMPASVQGIKSN